MDTEAQDDPRAEIKAEFRQWMQRLRKRMDVPQRGLARRLGLHYVTVCNWEKGVYFPDDMHRRMLNHYARDVQLEPMPQLPKTRYGPAPGTVYKKRRTREEIEADLAAAQHSPPTPQTANPA